MGVKDGIAVYPIAPNTCVGHTGVNNDIAPITCAWAIP